MDINVQIIEAIKDCPILYKTNATLSQRQQAWSKLALELNMQEQTLRSRWYLLCESYKRAQLATTHEKQSRNVSFKYAQEMAFLRAHLLQSKPKVSKQDENLPENLVRPEFIITEEDIAKDRNEDAEEFVFLEVEGMESNVEVEVNGSQQQEQHQEVEQPMQVQQQDQTQSKAEQVTEVDKTPAQSEPQAEEKQTAETINVAEKVIIKTEQVTATEEEKPQEQTKVDGVASTKNISIDEQSIAETMSAMSTIKTEPEVINSKENKSTTDNERCEDVIFGELVTAMLKRMPAEKKRLVKKDIMNALLT